MSHFRTNRLLLVITGLWPLKTNVLQKLFFSLSIFFGFCHNILHVGTVIVASIEADIDVLLGTVPYILLSGAITIHLVLWLIKFNKIKNLLQRVYFTWEYFLPVERLILEKYAHKSRILTKIYIYVIYGPIIPYMFFQLYRSFKTPSAQVTGTTIHVVFDIKNFFGIGNYYYSVFAISFFGTFAIANVAFAIDSIFVVFIQHASGMFAVLTQRLHDTKVANSNYDKARNEREKNRKIIIECLAVHQSIIEFSDLINTIFSLGLLISVTLYTVSLSFASFCALEYRNMPNIMFRFVVITSGSLLQMFLKFWQCQTLINHSSSFRNAIYGANWYNLSPKTRIILCFMLMRSEKDCKASAGKFFDMSFQSFSKILSAAISYFALLSHLRKSKSILS
ncbi:odorant receptor 9a-like [Leptopilina heterotoma]|uniref:odorant receptor 9a-like n=1 Tax=Leptopilina heterotoma TaxID=63436 RepID=UPI001CAA3619|nr:odorant receptor 9a-like [Leptopilina heterotoma]